MPIKKKIDKKEVQSASTTNEQIQVVTPYISVTVTSKGSLTEVTKTVEHLLDKYKQHHLVKECNDYS